MLRFAIFLALTGCASPAAIEGLETQDATVATDTAAPDAADATSPLDAAVEPSVLDATPPPVMATPFGLLETLEDLAELGEKRAGTPEGHEAGDYVARRMRELGLDDVRFESFRFPRHEVRSATLTVGGEEVPFDVFEASGAGHVEGARLVFAGTATDAELSILDVEGKVALVRRSATFHRSSQYANLVRRGALAMLYVSEADENLIQIGSVRHAWEAMGTIPALTIGKEDGDRIFRALLRPLHPVRVSIDVDARSVEGEGRNVIGTIPGDSPQQILIGAHYDTWFTGSVDNGSGVAAMLGLANLRAGTRPPYTLTFVAFDGEEVALYGGYDYLRKHGDEEILAVVNFEMPSAEGSHLYERGIASSASTVIDDALRTGHVAGFVPYLDRPVRTVIDAIIDERLDALLAEIDAPYKLWVDLDFVTQMFGGIVPTDVQGLYRSGIPTVSTAVSSPWYHTTADTPDKVDLDFLAEGIARFDAALGVMMESPPQAFEGDDPALFEGEAIVRGSAVDVALTHHQAPLDGETVLVELFCNDFFEGGRFVGVTGSDGRATIDVDLTGCAAPRYVHVSAGAPYPRIELARSVP